MMLKNVNLLASCPVYSLIADKINVSDKNKQVVLI